MPREKNNDEQQRFIKGAAARRKQSRRTPRKDVISSSKEPSSKDDSLEFKDDVGGDVDDDQFVTPKTKSKKAVVDIVNMVNNHTMIPLLIRQYQNG